ncbi:hypothetical protein K490DRAFT_61677 [Saccharata proteae CBS 121410]|uniref:Uncharacterized protein n=1 Tax=Saccharata proteae CBS 121410 TaxID=1314787 RepID=A0A9P4I515_9PEZI|nr:hypothetical protein K490DRAFT_61677 [Saccharata proteae CBS 121410]
MASMVTEEIGHCYSESHRVSDEPTIDMGRQVKIFVGPDNIEYRLPEHALSEVSFGFAVWSSLNPPDPTSYLTSPQVSAKAAPPYQCAHLPTVGPKNFENFYIWVLTGSLPTGLSVAITNGGSRLSVYIAQIIQPQLVDLYVLAVKLDIPRLRTETLCAIHRCSRVNQEYAKPPTRVIFRALMQLEAKTPLCRYLTYAYIGLHDRSGVLLGQLKEQWNEEERKFKEQERLCQIQGRKFTSKLPIVPVAGPLTRLPYLFSWNVRLISYALRKLPHAPAYIPVGMPQIEDVMLMRDGLVQGVPENDMVIAMAYEAQGSGWHQKVGWDVLKRLAGSCGGKLKEVEGE